MIPPGKFPLPPPGPSPFAPPRPDDEAVPTPRAPVLAPWAPEGSPAPVPAAQAPSLGESPLEPGIAAGLAAVDQLAAPPPPWLTPAHGVPAAPPRDSAAAPPTGGTVSVTEVPSILALDAPGPGSSPPLAAKPVSEDVAGPMTPASPRRRADRRWLLAGVAGGLVNWTLIATGGAYAVVRPWVRLPQRDTAAISADFAQVERWAKTPAPSSNRADALAGAATLVARRAARVTDREIPRIELAALSVDERAALEALRKWHAEKGGFSSAGCAPPRAATSTATSTATGTEKPAPEAPPATEAYLVLGGLGLVTSAGTPEEIQGLEATLALADALRLRGNLREHAIGVRLARLSAQWTHARKYTVSPRFESHRPRLEHLRAALARDAVCTIKRLDPGGGWSFDARGFAPDEGPRPPLGLMWHERERLVVEDFVGQWLVSTRDARTAKEIADRLAELPAPSSVVLRAAVPPVATLQAIAQDYAEYDRLLPSPRPARRRDARPADRRSRTRGPATPFSAAPPSGRPPPDREEDDGDQPAVPEEER